MCGPGETRPLTSADALSQAAGVLRALSSERRVAIVGEVLAMNDESGPAALADLAGRLGADSKGVAKEVARLIAAGLLQPGRDGITADVTWLGAVADIVAEQTPLSRAVLADSGLRRYLTNGRLSELPKRPEELEAMAVILAGLLPSDRTLSENEVNDLLAEAGDDVARLRRLLADFGLVTRSGSAEYRRT